MTTSNIKAVLPCNLSKLWEIVLDVDDYDTWRSDLRKAEKIDEKQFVEYTPKGYATTFSVTCVEKHKRWEFDMENSNMKGHWIGVFTPNGNETEIDFTEYIAVKKVYMKPFVKAFLKKQQAQFVADLRKAVEKLQ